MSDQAIDPGIVGYVRLSRDEEREKGVSMEEKIRLRRQILLTIASFNSVALSEDQIAVELMGGGSLCERAGLLEILERCRRREVHTVVCFDIDRLTRDVADLKTITQAFFRGQVTLITQRGVHLFDRNYDTTMIQILAILGEKERRSFSFRRKATNEERTRRGQKSAGFDPYGYRWDAAHLCYRVQPAEYPIVAEIFRRAWSEGINLLGKDLNARGIPGPGIGKRENCNPGWHKASLHNLLTNPIYSGHLVKRRDVDREGESIVLPASRWIWSDQPLQTLNDAGEWESLPHPVTRDEWDLLQEIRSRRRISTPNAGILTGLIFCSAGKSMCRRGRDYGCACAESGSPHAGTHVTRWTVEHIVWQLAASILAGLASLPPPKRKRSLQSDGAHLEAERRALLRDLREKEETLQDLIGRSAFYRRLPHYGTAGPDGKSTYDRTLETLASECEQLAAKASALADRIDHAHRSSATADLRSIGQAHLTPEAMESLPYDTARRLVLLIVRRITLEPPPGPRAMTRTIHVETHPLNSVQETRFSFSIHHANSRKSAIPNNQGE